MATHRKLGCHCPDTGEYEAHIAPTISYWPAPSTREEPKWLNAEFFVMDYDLGSLLRETYTALDNDLRVLAAIGIRTVFDRASELLGVDPNKSFTAKLDELAALGKIGPDERAALDVLTDAGSAAAHRGWAPDSKALDTMMDVIEALYRAFVLDAAAKKLKEAIPQRKSAPKA